MKSHQQIETEKMLKRIENMKNLSSEEMTKAYLELRDNTDWAGMSNIDFNIRRKELSLIYDEIIKKQAEESQHDRG